MAASRLISVGSRRRAPTKHPYGFHRVDLSPWSRVAAAQSPYPHRGLRGGDSAQDREHLPVSRSVSPRRDDPETLAVHPGPAHSRLTSVPPLVTNERSVVTAGAIQNAGLPGSSEERANVSLCVGPARNKVPALSLLAADHGGSQLGFRSARRQDQSNLRPPGSRLLPSRPPSVRR